MFNRIKYQLAILFTFIVYIILDLLKFKFSLRFMRARVSLTAPVGPE